VAGSAAILAATGVSRAPAKAAQFELKCGTNLPIDHPANVRLTSMWAAIEKESGGRVHVRLFPNSVLGNDPALFNQMRVGAVDFHLATPGIMAGVIPVANISYLGFAYKDSDEALRVNDGPLGAYIRSETDAKGMHPLRTIWNSGMRVIGSNTHPIRNPDDMRGFKVRAVESSITVDLFKMLGASPVPLSPNEVYTALQTKLVDGEDAPMVTIQTSRWYEVNKYISLTNHAWSGLWLLANGAMWKGLPSDLQDIVERNNTKYAMLERRDTNLFALSVADKLTRQGVTINDVDQAPFRARLTAYYQTWANTFGPTAWGLLQSSLGRSLT
jgi:TRAP-type transport system periplasmic protein